MLPAAGVLPARLHEPIRLEVIWPGGMLPAAEYPTRDSGSRSQWLHLTRHLRSTFDDAEAVPSYVGWDSWMRHGRAGQRLQWRFGPDEVSNRHIDSYQDTR